MGLTEPQFTLAVTFASSWTIEVELSGDSWTTTIPAGTYYLDGSGSADDLLKVIGDELTTDDIAATSDGTAVWAATLVVPASGLGASIRLARTGISKTLTKLDFQSGFGQILGASQDAYTGSEPEVVADSGILIIWVSQHQCRYHWRPRELLTRSEFKPRRTIARSRSVTGRVVTDGYSSGWHDRPILIEPVKGALVFQWMADDAIFAADVPSLVTGDPNIALERFWLDLMAESSTSGVPPTVRLAVDFTAPATHSEIWLSDGDFLENMEAALEEVSPSPALYRVNLMAQTVIT